MLERPPIETETESAKAVLFYFDEKVKPLVQKINADYLYWDKAKYLTDEKTFKNRMLWFAAKQYRKFNYKNLTFGKYTFYYTITNEILELLHDLDMNIGGYLTSENILLSQDKNRYLVNSIMEEAIASSQMEGAITTRKVAKDMLRKNEKPKNKSQQMIVNNYQTINYIKNNSQVDFSVEQLKEIHRSMTINTLDDTNDVGKIRDNDNILVMDGITGDIAHNPPSNTEIEKLLSDFEKFFNQSSDPFIHPIIKGIVIHFMLAYIHPFADGNGRTARSLFYWFLLKQGYWMVEYLSISRIIYKSKRQYEKAFLYTEYDDNDLTYFILYNLRAMKIAFNELKQYLKRKTEESNSVSLLAHIKEINIRQAQILKILTEKPNSVFTIKEIETRFRVSNQTARTDLTELKKLCFLSEIQINKRKAAFIKSAEFEEKIKSFS
ncbi:MAG: Fic family protein [Flavobacteriaceae bacterium]|jgi:Fic family protein|nr:Fic family protein [Flavobacteriaceae bacterium]